jgi:hypothetical protein
VTAAEIGILKEARASCGIAGATRLRAQQGTAENHHREEGKHSTDFSHGAPLFSPEP